MIAQQEDFYLRYLASCSLCVCRDLVLSLKLYKGLCPKTAANFAALCTGEKGENEQEVVTLCYAESIFHRVVPNGWVQGGGGWSQLILVTFVNRKSLTAHVCCMQLSKVNCLCLIDH